MSFDTTESMRLVEPRRAVAEYSTQSAAGKPAGVGTRILVALASYGTKNQEYLMQVIREYRSMPYSAHIEVLSNIPRELGPEVNVRVGLPDQNPWSLPFAHKAFFEKCLEDYDLFIYSEDDILISQRNIDAFLRLTAILPPDLIAGFFHAERDRYGGVFYDPLLTHFHWDPSSVRSLGDYTLAFFTNEHSACFMLTQDQLRKAIRSGGFLVPPHEGKYDLLCTAATDPYTQCGFKKMVCISHLEDFTVLHLPNNKHAVHPYRARSALDRQIRVLLGIRESSRPRTLLFNPETKVLHGKWSKSYYEPVCHEMISLIPRGATSVLSFGMASGTTEAALVEKGLRVVGVPMDAIVGECAPRGVEVVFGSFEIAMHTLQSERFSCILLSNVLHLVKEPAGLLNLVTKLMRKDGTLIISAPNFRSLPVYWHRFIRDPQYRDLGNIDKTGITLTSLKSVKKWFKRCGLKVVASRRIPYERARGLYAISPGGFGAMFTDEFVIAGQKDTNKTGVYE